MPHYRQLNAGRMENIRLPWIPITTVSLLSSKLNDFFSAFLTVSSLISQLLSSQQISAKTPHEIKKYLQDETELHFLGGLW